MSRIRDFRHEDVAVGVQPGQVDAALAVGFNIGILVIVNIWPTWREMPFVLPEAAAAAVVVNVAAGTAVVLNAMCLILSRRWMKPLTESIAAAFWVVLSLELWRTFPFAFPVGSSGLDVLVHIAIVGAIAAAVVVMLVQFITLIVRLSQDDTIDRL